MKKARYIWQAPAPGVGFHFFASSLGSWKTSTDVMQLVDDMKRENLSFNVFFVPLPADAEYRISNYAPVVEGAKFIGFWGLEG